MPVRLKLSRSDYLRMPWKNGLGVTEQIAIAPAGASLQNFERRVSAAQVDAGGPFSLFPGYQRVLVVTHGNGLRLNGRLVPPLVPFAFSGDEVIESALVDGPVRDFNVIARTPMVCVVCAPGLLSGLVTCVRGAVGGDASLAEGETVIGRDMHLRALRPDTLVIAVSAWD